MGFVSHGRAEWNQPKVYILPNRPESERRMESNRVCTDKLNNAVGLLAQMRVSI